MPFHVRETSRNELAGSSGLPVVAHNDFCTASQLFQASGKGLGTIAGRYDDRHHDFY